MGRAFALLTVLLAALPALAAPDPVDEAINALLDEHRLVNLEAVAEQLAPHGDTAVERLVARYEADERPTRRRIPPVLCMLPSTKAADHVLRLLRDRPDGPGLRSAIHGFPTSREEEMLPVLLDRLYTPGLRLACADRLRLMVRRKPARAGAIIRHLDDAPADPSKPLPEYEVLAAVSGYGRAWYPLGNLAGAPAKERNRFWRDWWERNGQRGLPGWLDEPLALGPSVRAHAAQVLGWLESEAAIPRLVALLADEEQRVRYWAVVGLRALEDREEQGYLYETFVAEEDTEVARLRERFRRQGSPDGG